MHARVYSIYANCLRAFKLIVRIIYGAQLFYVIVEGVGNANAGIRIGLDTVM